MVWHYSSYPFAVYTMCLFETDSNVVQARPVWASHLHHNTMKIKGAVKQLPCDSRGGQSEWKTRRRRINSEKAKEGGERVGLKSTRHYQPHSAYLCINLMTQPQRKVPRSKLSICSGWERDLSKLQRRHLCGSGLHTTVEGKASN